MDKPRPCGCKGRRTCLICEKSHGLENKVFDLSEENGTFVYCPMCNCAWPGWNLNDWQVHPNHSGVPLSYPGIYIGLDFLSEEEEQRLIKNIDNLPWDLSQSGRRKQNFGPKCNFKKRRLRLGDFRGFPKFSQFVQEKFKDVPVLKGFQTIEQCSLEYNPDRGASIDPHIDDCWIWGERIVTVNLLSDSMLTMTYNKKLDKYNLNCIDNYPAVLDSNGKINVDGECYKLTSCDNNQPIVRIPMPNRSLLVMYGPARYYWEHQVLREDIACRRVCLAYREFTPPYLPSGEKFEEGRPILNKASEFLTNYN
ncbi:hypothetical protein ILUMI_12568 [Ignelater luminosus]|uniref:Uncharacterized protein n=1 Tax=Ignelater luminosus TaxID=2038154 RepID=A0A8K0D2K2_IGNLU|nr:hypothetical protein ILUMI_12568 [Ignelater luminosus]